MSKQRDKKHVFLITGAGGFLGGRLLRLLRFSFPEHVILAVLRNKKKKPLIPAERYASKIYYGDLTKKKTWSRLPKNITHVFHLASSISHLPQNKKDPKLVFDNLEPVNHLIEASARWPLQQVIYSSSISIYRWGKGVISECSEMAVADFYSMSKLAGEIALSVRLSVPTASLRYGSLYGRGHYPGTVLPLMVRRAEEGKGIEIWGAGRRTQDFLYVEDAALANLLAYLKKAKGAYNIGSGVPVSMSRLADSVNRLFSKRKTGILFKKNKTEGPSVRLNISKARRELGFQPRPLVEEGLRQLRNELTNGFL